MKIENEGLEERNRSKKRERSRNVGAYVPDRPLRRAGGGKLRNRRVRSDGWDNPESHERAFIIRNERPQVVGSGECLDGCVTLACAWVAKGSVRGCAVACDEGKAWSIPGG